MLEKIAKKFDVTPKIQFQMLVALEAGRKSTAC
jgi:hypothetical protein